MITYLINMTLCALLLYALYALWFESEKMHRFKRFYLLSSLAFSMIVPLIVFEIDIATIPANLEMILTGTFTETALNNPKQFVVTQANTLPENVSTVPHLNYALLAGILYVIITSLLLFRFARNCRQMLVRGRKNEVLNYHGANLVLVKEKVMPHSFGRTIFINKADYENHHIPDEIIFHEWAHVRQRHTVDILLIELLIIFGWFNPVFYLYRNKIRQNHEFLADEAVIGSNQAIIPAYIDILIKQIPQNKIFNYTSNFNFQITKKRLVMMTKTTSKKRVWCSSIALIPVWIAAICVFSTKTIAQQDMSVLLAETNESVEMPVQDDNRMITPGKGASPEQMEEFRAIIDKYFDINKEPKWTTPIFSENEKNLLYAIYVQMDEGQRKEQYVRFEGPLTSSPNNVSQNTWKTRIDPKNAHEIWIDGEKIEYSTLASYAQNDFSYYGSSAIIIRSTTKNGIQQAEFEYFAHSKGTQIRLYLWTKKAYEAFIQQNSQQTSISKLMEIPPHIILTHYLPAKQ